MGFELRQQIERGDLPELDRIYIPMGLRGTATGLLLGLQAAGLKSRLVMVYVQPHDTDGVAKTKGDIIKNLQKFNAWLRQRDASFPLLNVQPDDFDVVCDLPGQKTGTLLSEGVDRIESVRQDEGITLEPTWTAPAWAAMQRDIRAGQRGSLLFWHTYNTQPPPVDIEGGDYHQLPRAFHHYFEAPTTLVNKPIFAKD
jgi:D-cysteine desulfhydrase